MSSKKKRSYSSLSRLFFAIILAMALVLITNGGFEVLAVSGIWQGTVSNIWNRAENWMPGGYPNAAGELAFFDGGTVPRDVVISATQVTVGGIIFFNNASYNISEVNGGGIIFDSGSSFPASVFAMGRAAHSISAPVELWSNLSLTNKSTGELTLFDEISEPSGENSYTVEVRSGSPVVFLGENSYSGGTNIRGGTLLLGNNQAVGSGSISLSCSTNPCNTPDIPASLGNYAGDIVLDNQLVINHSFVQFKGPGSMSFTSLDSRITTSAKMVITGTLNLAKLQDPTYTRNLRRSGPGNLNLNITPEDTNIGAYIRSDAGSGLMNLYGSGTIGRIYYRDGSGGGTIGVGDNLDVVTGELTRSTGILTVTGVLQTGTNSAGQADRIVSFDLRGTLPGSGYDQILIQELDYFGLLSTARITDTVLSVAVDPNFDPPLGTEFTLIQRTGGDGTPDDKIFGTFRGLPDGSTLLVDHLAFTVEYTDDTVKLIRCVNPILTITGGSPQSTMVGMPFSDRLEVTAHFPDYSPAVGLKIYFSAPSSGASAVFAESMPVITGPDGKASISATANMVAGSYLVTASPLMGSVAPVFFQLTNLVATPVWLEVSGFPSPVQAGESGTFTVTVRDRWNQIYTDYAGTVTFSSDNPNASLPIDYTFKPEDAGQHLFSATFFTSGESYYLRATDTLTSTLTGEQTGIAVLPADPSEITILSGSSQTTQVGTPFTQPLVVRLTDAYSNTVPAVAVTFSGPLIGAGAVFTGTNPANTDLNGQASLTVGANTVAGSYQVTAEVAVPGVEPVRFDLTNTPGPVVALQVFGYPSPVKAGSSNPFTVSAVDKFGNINPGYRGSTYSLSSDPLAILPQDYLFNAQDAGTHVFNAMFRTAGTHYITIVDNQGLRGTQSGIQVEALEPALLVVDRFTSQSAQSTQVTTLFPKPLAVVLTDVYGNPQSGFTITFTVPSIGASATLVGLNPQVTGADGRVSLDAVANTVAGTYEVLVSTNAPGVLPIKFSLTNLPGPASSLTYISGASQKAPLGKPFGDPLVVEVKDMFGNLVPNVSVTFTAPLYGPSCVLESGGVAITGPDGLASLRAEANLLVGNYVVEARLAGVSNPVIFELTNLQLIYLPVLFR